MRTPQSGFLALCCCLLCASQAGAGVYVPSQKPLQGNFQQTLMLLQQLDDRDPVNDVKKPQPPSDLRRRFLDRVAAMEKKEKEGTLQPWEMIDLGGLYIRLGRIELARRILEQARLLVKNDKSLLYIADLNLAAAYARSDADLLPKAAQFQEEALKNWPTASWDWGPDFLIPNRRLEELELRRLKDPTHGASATGELRLAEVLFPAPSPLANRPLVPGLRFGKGENYVIGGLPPDMWAFLPPDALQLVEQLLYSSTWEFLSPRDTDLLWLYAELLNATGQPVEAADMMSRLVDQGANYRDLFNHRQLLIHRSDLLAPDRAMRDVILRQLEDAVLPPPGADGPAPDTPKSSSSWPPDWKTLIVGFLAGLLMSTLGALQFREWGRRKGNTIPGDSNAVTAPPTPEIPVATHPAQPIEVARGGDDRGLPS